MKCVNGNVDFLYSFEFPYGKRNYLKHVKHLVVPMNFLHIAAQVYFQMIHLKYHLIKKDALTY